MTRTNLASAADYFGSMAESYDSLIRRCVPRYEEMSSRLIDYLAIAVAGPAAGAGVAWRILELGCGTGNLSLRLAQRFPNAQLTLVDAAPEMIELTRARLEAAKPQLDRLGGRGSFGGARFITSRFEDLKLPSSS